MSLMQMVLVWGFGLVVLVLVLGLILKDRLREKYALLWIFACLAIITAPFLHSFYLLLMGWFNILDSTTFYFICGFGLLLLLSIQFSLALSSSWQQRKTMVIQIVLMSQRIDELEMKLFSESDETNA